MLSLTRSRWETWKPNLSFCLVDLNKQEFSVSWGKDGQVSEGRQSLFSSVRPNVFTSFPHRSRYVNVPTLGQQGLPTFPWATSSLWAAEADLTRALVAAAIDLAASKICSSKSRVSSACYNQKKTVSRAIPIHTARFLANYLLLGHLALHPAIAFCWQTTPG